MLLKRGVLAVGLSFAIASGLSSAGIIGFLGNFDVINDTGKVAHGFEIDLEGLHSADITDVFGGPGRGFPTGRGFDPATSVERYGSPTITDYVIGAVFGTKVTYRGLFDGVNWDFGTPSGTFVTPGDNCWSGGGVGYGPTTPCDHFGVGTAGNATKTTYSWLVETATPGVLSNGVVSLPAPVWTNPIAVPVGAPPGAPAVPLVVAEVQAPAPEAGNEFGDALWVKVYTTELEDEVELEDLIAGQPQVDLALENTEIEWQLLQVELGNPDSGKLENEGVEEGAGKTVLRRYEFFDFSGLYDPESHEALFAFGDTTPNICDSSNPAFDPANVNCDISSPDEVGHYRGAQNGAAILGAPVVPGVPEPETYALLLAGLGVMNWVSRRRRQTAATAAY